jgi:hypothetical protein
MSNVKNYMEQGGERWIIGGTIEMSDGTHIKLGAQTLKAILDAKLTAAPAAAQADVAEGADAAALRTAINGLYAALRTAGILASE